MKVIDLINMINNKKDLPEKMIINKRKFHSNVFKDMIYEEDCNTDIWIAIQLKHIDLDDYVEIMQVELIEDEIEIEGIEKIITGYSESGADTDIINYINDKIVPSIKQLNKEIKELKEK